MNAKSKINSTALMMLKTLMITSLAILIFSAFGIDDSVRGNIGLRRESFVISSLLISICGLLSLFVNRKAFRFSYQDCFVLIFGVYVVSNYYVTGSIAETKFLLFLLLPILYFNLRLIIASDARIMLYGISLLLLYTGLSESWIGIKQLLGISRSTHAQFNITGTFYNPGPYGGYLAVILSIASAIIILNYPKEKIRWENLVLSHGRSIINLCSLLMIIACITAITTFIVLPSTHSRTAWIAALLAIVTVILTRGRVWDNLSLYYKRHKKVTVIIIVSSIFAFGTAGYFLYNLKKGSADGRLLMWKVTAKTIAKHPVSGVGLGHFAGGYADSQADYFANGKHTDAVWVAGSPEYSFNEYLQIASELGVVGLVVFLMIVVSALKRLFTEDYVQRALGAGLLALLIFASASYPLSLWPFIIIFTMLCAAGGDGVGKLPLRKLNYTATIAVAALAFAGTIAISICLRSANSSYKDWNRLSGLYANHNYDITAERYSKIYPRMKDNFHFLFEYGVSLNRTGDYRASNAVMQRGTRLSSDPMFYNVMGNNYKALNMPDSARICYTRAYDILPARMYPLFLLMKLYDETGDAANAVISARQIVNMREKVKSPATEEMKSEAFLIINRYTDR